MEGQQRQFSFSTEFQASVCLVMCVVLVVVRVLLFLFCSSFFLMIIILHKCVSGVATVLQFPIP